ncbi:MAG: hypothetical protein K2Q15_03970, partial [Burkholderiales bacterium]|nr:hypothetical protein [Burkholderiales bacterium]
AGPLAALAAAQISEQLRGVERDDQLAEQQSMQDMANSKIQNLTGRMGEAEGLATRHRDGLLETAVSNATAIIHLQQLFSKYHLGV